MSAVAVCSYRSNVRPSATRPPPTFATILALVMMGTGCNDGDPSGVGPAAIDSVVVAPETATVLVRTQVQFTARVFGRGNFDSTVAWLITPDTLCGVITSSGVYRSPISPPTVDCSATGLGEVRIGAYSAADSTKSSSATIAVSFGIISIALNPALSTVLVRDTLRLRATVDALPNADPTLRWLVNNVAGGDSTIGTIDSDGLYSAPPTVRVPSPTIRVVSVADSTKSAVASVTLTYGITQVALSPAVDTITIRDTLRFTATITALQNADRSLRWAVNGIPGGDAAVGTISSAGRYSAPLTIPVPSLTNPSTSPQAVIVTATSVADTTKMGVASLAIVRPPIAYWGLIGDSAGVCNGPCEAIFVANECCVNSRRITPLDIFQKQYPSWSPDGSRLSFYSNRDSDIGLYIMMADGSGTTRVSNGSRYTYGADWSPDGTRFTFVGQGGDWIGVATMNVDGSAMAVIADSAYCPPGSSCKIASGPRWSPDGRTIAFGSRLGEIMTVNPDGTGLINLTNHPAKDITPAWSPDGTRIAFSSDRVSSAFGPIFEIFVMNADGSGLQRLTFTGPPTDEFNFASFGPAWSPDGARIAFTRRDLSGQYVYIMNADGSGPLLRMRGQGDPAWRPRGWR